MWRKLKLKGFENHQRDKDDINNVYFSGSGDINEALPQEFSTTGVHGSKKNWNREGRNI